MHWMVSLALAQDCHHTPLVEVRAAEWAAVSPEVRQLGREKRHESLEFVKGLTSGRTLQGDQKAELMLRLAELYLDEGVDALLRGDRGEPWFEKAGTLARSIREHHPTYARNDQALEVEIEALTWLGRYADALALEPQDEHVRADLLWAVGRFDEACAIHPQDDPRVEPHPVLADLQAVRRIQTQPVEAQVAWLREHPDNPYVDQLLEGWLRDDVRLGLVAWFTLFPLSDAQLQLTPEQLRDIASHPDVHIEPPPVDDGLCARYSAAAAACLQGDPTLAAPLTGESDLTACLDVEVWLRSRPEPCPVSD